MKVSTSAENTQASAKVFGAKMLPSVADIFQRLFPIQPLLPLPKVLREDFSSLGVEPMVTSVAAADLRLAGDHRAWDISWVSIPGNVMESANFSCSGSNITSAYSGEGTCIAALVQKAAGGNPISGTFTLKVLSNSNDDDTNKAAWGASEITINLAYNSTATEVQTALQELSGVAVADVELINSLSEGRSGGSTYLIAFPGATGATSPMGGVSLTASEAGLDGTGVRATVREVHPGSRWGGEFALSIGGLEGSRLPFDADAEKVREDISNLIYFTGGEGGKVDVWRDEVEAGFRWAVAFSGGDLDGDMDLMEVRCSLTVVVRIIMNSRA